MNGLELSVVLVGFDWFSDLACFGLVCFDLIGSLTDFIVLDMKSIFNLLENDFKF